MGSSPRPWGCFQRCQILRCFGHVFPTPVGVFLAVKRYYSRHSSLPHARGGVSNPFSDSIR